MAAESIVRLVIMGESAQAIRAIAKTEGALSGMAATAGTASAKTSASLAKIGKTAAIAAGVAGVALLYEGLKKSIDAAEAAQVSTAKLDTAFRDARINLAKYGDQLDRVEASGRKLGFTNIDTREGLAKLVTATQNAGKAFKDLGIARDLARFLGGQGGADVSLASASKILSSAMAGSTRAARQLGIAVVSVHTQTTKVAIAYDAAKKKIDAAFPSTSKMTAAMTKQKQALLDNLKVKYESIKAEAQLTDKNVTSTKVLGEVEKRVRGSAKAFSDTAQGGMQQFHAQIEAIEENIGAHLLPAVNKVIDELNRLLVWLQTPAVKAALDKYWNDFKTVFTSLAQLIKPLAPLFKVAFEAIILETHIMAQAIATGFRAMAVVIQATISAINWFNNTVKGISGSIKGPLSAIGGAFQAAFDPVVNVIKTVIHWIQTLIGWVNKIPNLAGGIASLIPGAGIASSIGGVLGHIPTPHLPGFLKAAGGPVLAGHPYLVGERGPELFMPRMSGSIVPNNQLGGGGPKIDIHFANGMDWLDKYMTVFVDGKIQDLGRSANLRARGGRR